MTHKLDFPPDTSQFELTQIASAAHNVLSPRSTGRKMSTAQSVIASVIRLPTNADGRLDVTLKGLTITNFVKQGNFSAITEWIAVNSVNSIASNTCSNTGDGTANAPYIRQNLPLTVTDNKKLYLRVRARVTNAVATNIRAFFAASDTGNGVGGLVSQNSPVQNQWYTLSGILSTNSGRSGVYRFITQHSYVDAATANGKVMEVQEAITSDLTQLPADIQALSDASIKLYLDVLAWFDGTKPVQAQRIKVTGKNLFDKNKAVWGGMNTTTGAIPASTTQKVSDYMQVVPNTVYSRTAEGDVQYKYCYYDKNRNFINGEAAVGARTTPINCYYVRIGFDTGADINAIQFEIGATPTAYEPYFENISYAYGSLNSLPNGIKDEIGPTGVKIQRVKEYILLASDITNLVTTNTNVDIVAITKKADSANSTAANFPPTYRIVPNYTPITVFEDNVSKIGSTYDAATSFGLIVQKGAYANLAAAQAAFAGMTIYYQLATQIVTYLSSTYLDVLPGSSIIIDPIIHGVKLPIFGSGKIPVTTVDAPISAIESVYRIDIGLDGLRTKTDVTASFTLDADKLGITCATADSKKAYEYICLIDSAYSTVPMITYSYPEAAIQDWAVASHSYGSAAADWVLDANEAKCGVLVATAASGAANIIAPDKRGQYWVQNDSTQTLTLKKAGGVTTQTVATGKKALFIHTGTDYIKFSEL